MWIRTAEDEALWDRLVRYAEAHRMSQSAVVLQAVEAFLDEPQRRQRRREDDEGGPG